MTLADSTTTTSSPHAAGSSSKDETATATATTTTTAVSSDPHDASISTTTSMTTANLLQRSTAEEEEEDEDATLEFVAPLHMHATRTPVLLRGSVTSAGTGSRGNSRSSSRSRSPANRKTKTTTTTSATTGGGGGGVGTFPASSSTSSSSPATAAAATKQVVVGGSPIFPARLVDQPPPAATHLNQQLLETSLSNLEVMLDPDILLDKMGLEELEPQHVHHQYHHSNPNLSYSSLPPVNERLSEETLDDVHAFSDLKIPSSTTTSCSNSIASSTDASRANSITNEAGGHALETLDEEEFDEEEEGGGVGSGGGGNGGAGSGIGSGSGMGAKEDLAEHHPQNERVIVLMDNMTLSDKNMVQTGQES